MKRAAAKFTIERISDPGSPCRFLVICDEVDLLFGWAKPSKDFLVFDSRRDALSMRARMGSHADDALVVEHTRCIDSRLK